MSARQNRSPILRLGPRLEVVEGDVGELAAEGGAIHRIADAVEPFVHPGVEGLAAKRLVEVLDTTRLRHDRPMRSIPAGGG
jgi:hypothetical protein